MKYTLAQKQLLTPTSLLITLEPQTENAIESFHAGQYASLSFKRHGRPTPARCLSFVNTSNDRGTLQFGVRVQGKFTSALANLNLGSSVDVEGPFGSFVYDPQYDSQSVMLAGGIGITPIMSIITHVTQQKMTNPMTLFYSVRDQNDVPFADELLKFEQQNPYFRVVFLVSRGDTSHFDQKHVLAGYVTPELIARAAKNDFQNTSFFVCGPASYMESILATLQAQNTPDLRINTESFAQSKSAVEKRSMATLTRQLTSVYGLTAMAFLAIITAITTMDVRAHSVAKATPATSTVTPTQTSDDSSSESTTTPDDTSSSSSSSADTAPTPTPTPISTPQPTYVQTYQQPRSSVS